MSVLLLESLPLDLTGGFSGDSSINLMAILLAPIMKYIILSIIGIFVIYLYLALAYSKISKKAKLNNPGIAWMPYMGVLAVIFESAEAHWWPFLVSTIGLLLSALLGFLGVIYGSTLSTLSSVVLALSLIVFGIMTIIWHWKTYEVVGKPGWWILITVVITCISYALMYIGNNTATANSMIANIGTILLAVGFVVHLILVGIVAWTGKE